MRYVDGFVLPVPRKKLAAYRRMARLGCKVWMDHGALGYCEAIGDDLFPKGVAHFPRSVKAKAGETVFFSWIAYKSKAHRDRVNAKVMKDPRLGAMKGPMPFDLKRMYYGGFRVLVKS
jgi:uncharacterized protein YbaA (DUF1428 family)